MRRAERFAHELANGGSGNAVTLPARGHRVADLDGALARRTLEIAPSRPASAALLGRTGVGPNACSRIGGDRVAGRAKRLREYVPAFGHRAAEHASERLRNGDRRIEQRQIRRHEADGDGGHRRAAYRH